MIDPFLSLSLEERRLYITQAALKGSKGAIIYEKDFWVCWLLKQLFTLPILGEHLIFKGGTSLSKAYGIIERFSEDIDMSFHRSFLGFEGDKYPENAQSANKRALQLEKLQQVSVELIKDRVFPLLKEIIASELEGEWSLEIDKHDPQALLFTYPSVGISFGTTYIRPVLKVEFGARSDNWPQEERTVNSYLSEEYPNILLNVGQVKARTLTIARTFWEKATILHAEFHRKEEDRMPDRYSRHYYDLFCISQSIHKPAILKDLSLLNKVAEHKMVFFRAKWANYESAKAGTLRLLPQQKHIAQLKADYNEMRPMFFSEPPNFDQILEELRSLEEEINKL